MTTEKKKMTVKGINVTLTENPGEPLLLLVRIVAPQMGVWDKIWDHLTRYYTVALIDLIAPDLDKYDSSVAVFRHYAQQCVDVAKGLGYDRFHILGWTGGTQVAMRCMVDFPQHLHSCILLGATHPPAEKRPTEKLNEIATVLLEHNDLELWTYYWLLSSFTPAYAEKHFDEVKALAETRVRLDKGRLDTARVLKWTKMIREQSVTDEELQSIQVPTLIVAPAFTNLSPLRRLNTLIKTSELAIIPGAGVFVFLEEPESFMAAAGPFLRAAAKGKAPVTRLAQENNITVIDKANRVEVLENHSDEAVVFLHGWLMSPQMWAHSLAALCGKIRCVALWQPGHGKSTAPATEYTMDEWTDWLIGTLDSLNVKKAILVGHSMGGMLALDMVLKYPQRVKGLVLVDTKDEAFDKTARQDFLQLVDSVAIGWSSDPALSSQVAGLLLSEQFLNSYPAWTGTWANEVAKYDLRGIANLLRAIFQREDYSQRVNEIGIPVLVVHGTADQAIPIDIGKAMVERIPGAQFEEMAGAGHCPPMETPEVFTEKLVTFLKKKQFID